MTDQARLSIEVGVCGFSLSQKEYSEISRFAYEEFGLNLSESKKPLVHSRLARRFRELGIEDFDQYWKMLTGIENEREKQHLLSTLTTNVTHFFREKHHFDILQSKVLPGLIKEARRGGRVRIWSAGCSSGPEPYSIAMTILDLCPEADHLDIKILGTDIDPEVIHCAQKGRYDFRDKHSIPESYVERFLRSTPDGNGYIEISARVRSLVTFGILNLVGELPFSGPFDVVFCRNVAIYFDQRTQERVWKNLCNVLGDDGYLFIGHSERLSKSLAPIFVPVGITAHRKASF